MLSRLDRYLLREVVVTFVAVTGVLLVILLSNQFARVLGQAAQTGLPGSIVVTLIGLTTLQQLTVLVPIGLFLGIVLALGRLYHESEMTAMTACGVGPLSIYRPIARADAADRGAARAAVAAGRARRGHPRPADPHRGPARRPVRRARGRSVPDLRRRRGGVLCREGQPLGPARGRVRPAPRRGSGRDRGRRACRAARRRTAGAGVRAVRRAALRGRARAHRVARGRVRGARHPGAHAGVHPEARASRAAADPRPDRVRRTARTVRSSPGASPCR